jgi:hypothetical protein
MSLDAPAFVWDFVSGSVHGLVAQSKNNKTLWIDLQEVTGFIYCCT